LEGWVVTCLGLIPRLPVTCLLACLLHRNAYLAQHDGRGNWTGLDWTGLDRDGGRLTHGYCFLASMTGWEAGWIAGYCCCMV
jgi:hypothetical protein